MPMSSILVKRIVLLLVIVGSLVFLPRAYNQQEQRGQTSYAKVDSTEPFESMMARMTAAKPGVESAHLALLNERYDLSDHPAQGVTMDRGKPVQEGIRVKLPAGMTWEKLAAMSPDQIRDQNLYPKGFYPLPHPNHIEGGFVFPHFLIDAIKEQDGRDLARFDIDFDLPDQFLAEFPPAIYLTPRPDLGDVSHGKLVSLTNYFEMFNGILTPRQLEGLRLLLTPFPQQQFNATDDRRSVHPSTGAACFDCHSNGHQNGATHLAPDARPQEYRHRIKTVSLRGVDIQRLFGSQRALNILTATLCWPRKKASTPLSAEARLISCLILKRCWTFHRRPSSTSLANSFQAKRRHPNCEAKRYFLGRANARAATRRLSIRTT
jgi:cytochrome c peroxidase